MADCLLTTSPSESQTVAASLDIMPVGADLDAKIDELTRDLAKLLLARWPGADVWRGFDPGGGYKFNLSVIVAN